MLFDLFNFIIFALAAIAVIRGICIVPQQQAYVIERLGRFDRVLEPGLTFIIPGVDRVAYKHILKEFAFEIERQTAITADNVPVEIDGTLYTRILDAKAASYGAADVQFAISQLAQTTMRAEIGKLTLDRTFAEREVINANIVAAINTAAQAWGIQCMRYEIRNIDPPHEVIAAMQKQMAAERQKRADILNSEGKRQADINEAEGKKRAIVLASEAAMTEQINKAKGEAAAILRVANATAEGIVAVAQSTQAKGGLDAISLKIAEQYLAAFANLAKETNTVLLPADLQNPSSAIAQALSIFNNLKVKEA